MKLIDSNLLVRVPHPSRIFVESSQIVMHNVHLLLNEGRLVSAANRSRDVHCHCRNMRYLAGESVYPGKGESVTAGARVRRDGLVDAKCSKRREWMIVVRGRSKWKRWVEKGYQAV